MVLFYLFNRAAVRGLITYQGSAVVRTRTGRGLCGDMEGLSLATRAVSQHAEPMTVLFPLGVCVRTCVCSYDNINCTKLIRRAILFATSV